jgi:hypothetical protein
MLLSKLTQSVVAFDEKEFCIGIEGLLETLDIIELQAVKVMIYGVSYGTLFVHTLSNYWYSTSHED